MDADDIPDQSGRTFLITGANSGLGYETSRQLARHGGTVIMTARDPDRGEQARRALRAEQPTRGSNFVTSTSPTWTRYDASRRNSPPKEGPSTY